MKEQMWERWRMEVYIIGKLSHDNVIRSVELPGHLTPPPGDPPVLAMEFCEGGDLRKVQTSRYSGIEFQFKICVCVFFVVVTNSITEAFEKI